MPNIVTREIFPSLPAVDGRYSDVSQRKRDKEIKELFSNTKRWLSFVVNGKPNPIPVAPHDTKGGVALGHLVDIALIKKEEPTKHFRLVGKFDLTDETFEQYDAGLLDGVSIVIDPNGANVHQYTGVKNDRIGPFISSVMIDGQANMAYPNLEKFSIFKNYPDQNCYAFYKLKEKPAKKEKKSHNTSEEYAMPMPKKDDFMDAMMAAMGGVFDKLFGDKTEEEPDKKEEDDKTPAPGFETKTPLDGQEVVDGFESDGSGEPAAASNDVNSQILEQLKAMNGRLAAVEKNDQFNQDGQAETSFTKHVKDGKLIAEQKKSFLKQVKDSGLTFTNDFYDNMHPQVPAPSGIEHVDTNDEKAIKETPEYKKWFTKFNESGRHTEEAAHEAALQAIGQELKQKQEMTA